MQQVRGYGTSPASASFPKALYSEPRNLRRLTTPSGATSILSTTSRFWRANVQLPVPDQGPVRARSRRREPRTGPGEVCWAAPRLRCGPERVVKLRERGLSIRAIADQTGVSAMTVQRILAGQGGA
jgi:hypothetical protein